MSDFEQHKEALNKKLEKFIQLLDELLPRYVFLLKKTNISEKELTELGEIEHYLIEVNAKISGIKNMLKEDLFGHSLDVFYKLKQQSNKGDSLAKAKYERMRQIFQESLKSDLIFIWN